MFDSLNGLFSYYAGIALIILAISVVLNLIVFFVLSKFIKIKGLFAMVTLAFSGTLYLAGMSYIAGLFLAMSFISIIFLVIKNIIKK